VVLLAAAALLCYVSLWLLSQKEARHWQQFLRQRIEQELARSNQWAVFLMAFIAVFREGAETILFYQALMIESQAFDQALWAGAATAAVLLVLCYFGLNRIIRLIRLDYFFKATAAMLFTMALIFTGKGVMEMQAAGWLSASVLDGYPMLPVLGVFPTREALGSQALLIVTFGLLFGWLWLGRRTRSD
jgi:high-affinity iron transporter